MDLDENIPVLLIGNTTAQEREIITTWVRDALAPIKPTRRPDGAVGPVVCHTRH
jgi:hypothetical protein